MGKKKCKENNNYLLVSIENESEEIFCNLSIEC